MFSNIFHNISYREWEPMGMRMVKTSWWNGEFFFTKFIFEKFLTGKSVVLNFVTLRLCCCGIFCLRLCCCGIFSLRLCCCGIFCKQMVLSVSVHCGRTGHASAISKQRTETEFPKYFSVHTFFRSDPQITAILITNKNNKRHHSTKKEFKEIFVCVRSNPPT